MNAELEQIFDRIPNDEPRSTLEPYRELILRWRRQGRTYRRICQLLNDECKINVAYAPLYRFVQRRSRPRKAAVEAETQPVIAAFASPITRDTELAAKDHRKLSPDEVTRQRALIQGLRNNKPVHAAEVRKRFVYDPDETLIIEPTIKDKQS